MATASKINLKRKQKQDFDTTSQRNFVCKNDCIKAPILNINVQNQMGYIDPVTIGEIAHIPDSVKYGVMGNITNMYFKYGGGVYKAEENLGVNKKNASKSDICLARYAKAVADEMDTGGNCYTGVKYALLSSGVINDYGDMPKGSAKDSIQYFQSNKEKFEEVNVNPNELQNLPAGYIIVYTKEGKDGHIAITNGNKQEMSDCTDNMKWLEKNKGGKATVFKLTDGWTYNPDTKKLQFDK
jgi:hypothetical protein